MPLNPIAPGCDFNSSMAKKPKPTSESDDIPELPNANRFHGEPQREIRLQLNSEMRRTTTQSNPGYEDNSETRFWKSIRCVSFVAPLSFSSSLCLGVSVSSHSAVAIALRTNPKLLPPVHVF
jgi:hypothetical protein